MKTTTPPDDDPMPGSIPPAGDPTPGSIPPDDDPTPGPTPPDDDPTPGPTPPTYLAPPDATERVSVFPPRAAEPAPPPMEEPGRRVGWVILALVGIGLVVRLVGLGGRALHHDESLDAWFSQRFFDGTYEGYDPVYHGPLRFYVTGALYWLFGISVTSARLISVAAGTGIIALPWFLRRHLGTAGTVAASAILAFSPSFVYYSRFAREDAFFAFLSLLFVVLLIRHIDQPRIRLLVALMLTLMAAWAVKESVFLLVLITGSFLLIELAHQALELGDRSVSPTALVVVLAGLSVVAFGLGEPIVVNLAWWGALVLAAVWFGLYSARLKGRSFGDTRIGAATLRPGALGWTVAVGLGAFVFIALFTVFFSTWSGSQTASTSRNAVFDGLVGGWDYWRSQQDVNRGGEPWFYYLFAIPLYEYVAVALAGFGLIRELRRSTMLGRYAIWSTIVSLAAYSYAGERMPWLILHPLLPIVLLAALGAQFVWEHRRQVWVAGIVGLVAVGSVFTLAAGYRAAYVDGEQPRELLSQAGQASPELAATVDRMIRLDRLVQAEEGRPLNLLVDSAQSAAWPYVFYLRDLGAVRYADLSDTTVGDVDVVISVATNRDAIAEDVVGFSTTEQFHREWWVPSYGDGVVSGWLGWLVDRDVWDEGEVGGVAATVYVSPAVGSLELRADDLGVGND